LSGTRLEQIVRGTSWLRRIAALLVLFTWLNPNHASAQALPSGWSTADVGSPQLTGSASHSNGTFTVTGAGVDIWNNSDQFRFVYRQLTGDGTIVARVATLQPADPWTKVGVMIRETLNAGAKNTMTLVSAANGLSFQRRVNTSGHSVSTKTPGGAPRWIKLERKGSTFTGSVSTNGTSWQVLGTATVSMGATTFVGLAVTSHNPSARATATFSNVTVSTTTTPPPPSNTPPTLSITAPTTGATVSGVFQVRGTASDNTSVSKVEIRIDSGAFALASGTQSWTYSWNTATVPNGTRTITARATDSAGLTTTQSVTANVSNTSTTTAAGVIPDGFPRRFTVGLYEEHGGTWMRDSGVPWDARYRYFVNGWVNNWGWSARDGSWGLGYLNECANVGIMPVVSYYVMNGVSGGNEGGFLSTAQNAAKMTDYFGQWKILMQRVRDFGRPAVIVVEADGFGFLQQQTGGNPNTYAAVAATGMPELAGLPNTVAGWGLAFLQLRNTVGASNAILAMDISGWATGKDLLYFNVADPLGPEVDKAYAFLAPLGLAANETADTWDLIANNPLDRDSDYYTTLGQNRWWDASDAASISSRSFNRYAEWLRLWNVKAGKRWVLWQVPVGNSNHLNVYNNGGARQGYKDNRPEYFFANNAAAHRQKFASAGVIGVYFGPGTGGMSYHTNDVFTDGQLFMRSRAGVFLSAGGIAIN
jgi:hypothetical protein